MATLPSNFYVYLYWEKCPLGHIPSELQIITQIIFFFFHFRCILLQISHKKCCFISISILGRSGVKAFVDHTAPMYLSELVKKTRSANDDLLLVIPPLSKNCSNTFF